MLLPHATVIASVDGRNFELWRNAGNEAAPKLESLPSPRLDTHDKSAGARHYSSAGNPTGHQLDEDAHAAAVAAWLNGEVLGHRIEKLVVIAAPRTLGEVRRHLHRQTSAALLGEVAKDLIGWTGEDLIRALREKG